MSGAGAPTSQPYDASELKVAVVAASWHTQVMDGLVAGAERALAAYGISEPQARATTRLAPACPKGRSMKSLASSPHTSRANRIY